MKLKIEYSIHQPILLSNTIVNRTVQLSGDISNEVVDILDKFLYYYMNGTEIFPIYAYINVINDSGLYKIQIIKDLYNIEYISDNDSISFTIMDVIIGLFAENNIEKYWTVHGAAMEYNKKAIILLAPTNTGKSTTACALSEKGLKYLTDDIILIDRKTLKCYPLIKPIYLRTSNNFNFTEKGEMLLQSISNERRLIIDCFSDVDANGYDINSIYVLNRNDEYSEPDIVPLYGNDKLMCLLRGSKSNKEMKVNLHMAACVAQKVKCFEVRYPSNYKVIDSLYDFIVVDS